jgi:hypothetical protein
MNFGMIGFLQPLLLFGLLSLPIIWWLLRFTPPRPQEVAFPPIRLLLGLRSEEETPSRSPWWLTALRILIAALIIVALAGPVFNPHREPLAANRPLLLIVDNGWAAASRWQQRQDMIASLLQRTESNGQTVRLLASAGPATSMSAEPLAAAKARERAASLQPQPHAPNREALAKVLDNSLGQERGYDVVWLSDGIDEGASEPLTNALRRIAEGGELTVYADVRGSEPLALSGKSNVEKGLIARVTSPGGAPRTGSVVAMSGKGARLAETRFALAENETAVEAAFDLPLELRNQVTRLEIDGELSAGAVSLLDARSLWQRYGILSGEAREAAQPLLSPTHYIERALAPNGEVIVASTGNVESGTAGLLERAPSVIIMSDIGHLLDETGAKVKAWVEKGGVLIRFAGPRLEKGGDALLPVPLREGGRTMGGALSWRTPQKLAAFEETSPYYGLTIPADVLVSRQVLADPGEQMNPSAQVWARLEDGTPLVTASKLGEGQLVLFHVTGNSDWSNLPMSGLFVDMLRRTGEMSSLSSNPEGRGDSGAAGSPAVRPDSAVNNSRSAVLTPWRTLDGFGRMGPPPVTANALPAANPDAARPGPGLPPGFYGPPGRTRALNIMRPESNLKALEPAMAGGRVVTYEARKPLLLMPWLLLAAFALFAVDAMITLALMSGGLAARRNARATAASLAAIFVLAALAPGAIRPASAQTQDTGAADFALQASLNTRLAYVTTGDASVDEVSRQGLAGLSRVLAARTAIEPGDPMAVDVERDELVFFPLLYWPVGVEARPLSDHILAKVDAYMKQGGMIIFDTKDYQMPLGGGVGGQSPALTSLLGRLDIPRLEPVPEDHVLTKSFYLMRGFPGRWDGGTLWVEAQSSEENGETRRALKSDGVSSILITSNDFAGAWALDDSNRPMFAAVPGGEVQREMAFRSGVNIVMYALTGNYKADQVHVPALLERLGQ